jgi:uncharacterized phage protein (TIGR02216 family)
MRAAIAERGMRPVDFWVLTPAELLLILGRAGRDAPLSRLRLEELAAAYPDERSRDGE